MLIAAAVNSLPALSVADACSVVRDCGLQGIEIDLATLDDSRAELKRLASRGPRLTTLDCTVLDPQSSDWLDRIKSSLDDAAALDVPIVVISAGDDRGDQPLRQRLIDSHRRAADLVAARGLTLAWDTLPGLCGDAREMQRSIEQVGHPALRLNFDTGRYLQENPWSSGEVGLQRVCGHLASVRLTNFTVGVEPVEYPPLGQGGDVDFSRTGQILMGLHFQGPCTIAFRPAARRPPSARECETWLRASVDHLRGCGWFD